MFYLFKYRCLRWISNIKLNFFSLHFFLFPPTCPCRVAINPHPSLLPAFLGLTPFTSVTTPSNTPILLFSHRIQLPPPLISVLFLGVKKLVCRDDKKQTGSIPFNPSSPSPSLAFLINSISLHSRHALLFFWPSFNVVIKVDEKWGLRGVIVLVLVVVGVENFQRGVLRWL